MIFGSGHRLITSALSQENEMFRVESNIYYIRLVRTTERIRSIDGGEHGKEEKLAEMWSTYG